MGAGFHRGELLMQERAGVLDRAARVGGSIHREIPPAAAAFLEARRFVVLATADAGGRPWASVLSGAPGFASAPDPRTVRLDAAPVPGDPLAENLEANPFAGLLAIDLAARRRMRVNGRHTGAGRPIELVVDQAYSNCPKYIQRRALESSPAPWEARVIRRAAGLGDGQRETIRRADTFFLATLDPETGADASHRGGMPGFVRVDGDRLIWPDYVGNMMYNTLGNIAVHPRAGLLVPDFATGSVLQLTGRARIDWNAARTATVPGAERLVELEVEEVLETASAVPTVPPPPDYSPHNPPAG